jgi:SPP1 gp7 family putative phage head morphogenesis protein
MTELPSIKESAEDYEAIERAIKHLFRVNVYYPILRALGMRAAVQNSGSSKLIEAIRSGRITFSQGVFSGRLSASVSKELKDLGAKFKDGTFRITVSNLPIEIRNVISSSESRFLDKIKRIDKILSDVSPEELAGKLHIETHFDKALYKVESTFQKSVKKIAIAPELSISARERIASEWQDNIRLHISDFTKAETDALRTKIKENVFKGDRYGQMVKTIEGSYGVSSNKAKFLARQETALLMAKYKQTRYEAAGVNWYRWVCIKDAKTRPAHAALNGKIFRWDSPPVVDAMGDRKNPQQDYNCRCSARPMVGYNPAINAVD